MSNHQRYSSSSNRTQQQKFVPKSTPSQSLPNQTLSNSLRNQHSSSSGSNSNSDGQRRHHGGGNFVNYLPQDEAVAAGLGAKEGGLDTVESQSAIDLLNRECSRLLKLNPKDFWKTVASDTSVHAFLESYLKFRSRWYDFPYRGAKRIVAGVIVGDHELSQRVFMIFYRMSSNRDPRAKATDSLSVKDHADIDVVIMQEKKLLDLPKLLDICAIYGHENEVLTKSIVTNAIQAQPSIHDSFSAAISHFLSIVHTMYERCTTSIEVLLSSPVPQDDGSSRLHSDYLEVMDFINDAIVSMDAFISAYKQAALYFSCPVLTSYGSDELLKILARLHDSLLPTLQQGFQILFSTKKDDMLPKIAISLKILSSRIANFSWKLLNLCYLSEELFKDNILIPSASKIFPAQVEDPTIRADILIQTFREINEECSTIKDGRNINTLLQSIENNYQLINRLDILKNEGWLLMDNEQLNFLSGIITVSRSKSIIPHFSSNKTVEMDEDDAIVESKISQVKDLFPDYGKGFISACLDVYNNNPEEVIQRILEGTLHNDLLTLDTSLSVVPPKTATPAATIKDKGKGKLVEDYTPALAPGPTSKSIPIPTPATVLPQSSSSSSSVGRFTRKSTTNVSDTQFFNSKDETANSFALKSMREYEDEYDDSFDDLGLGVGDSGLDDLNEKVNSSETSSASNASRWGSRQKPQFFVKDGKNYSYKVSGSVAAANYNEASIVNQAQKGMIHGLGKGGNFPLGAAQKVMESNEVKFDSNYNHNHNHNQNVSMKSSEGKYEEQHQVGGRGKGRGWGRGSIGNTQSVAVSLNEREDRNEYGDERGRGGRGRGRRGGGRGIIGNEQNMSESNEGDDSNEFGERGRGGRGRGGRRGGGRTNHYRKDQAMKKHFSGLGGI